MGPPIIDDDPTPGLTIRTDARRITAGDHATWTLTLDKPVDYFAFAIARPVRAVAGPQLRVGDLTKRFRERFLGGDVDLGTPLYKSRLQFFVEIRQHRLSGSFSIPTRPRARRHPGDLAAVPKPSARPRAPDPHGEGGVVALAAESPGPPGSAPSEARADYREPVTQRPHHRPLTPGDRFFSGLESGDDPVQVAEAADRAAELLVRGARASGDDAVAERVLHLADTEGIEVIAQAWAARPAESVAGCLWRLYLLRSWVYADPVGVAREFEAGRRHAAVDDVVAGVADPPGPDELRDMVDEVLRGIAVSDFADVLLRAAAFARVVATGRAALADTDALAAARIQTVAEQLDRAARLELAGQLA